MSFNIGNIKIKGKVILAPMAGITSFSYRRLYKPFGCALVYSEMISDCGIIYNNKETINLCKTSEEEKPFALQIFGGEKDNLIKAVKRLEELNIDYDILDLNLACPVPKVTKNNGGSSWLLDQEKLYDMVSEVVKISTKPVSAKVRLGFNEINIEDTVVTLEKAGVKFIAIHARTKKQLYSGEPDYNSLKNIHKLIKIPFAVSGNIYSVKDALHALKVTKANAILVARGAVGNPLLIRDINNALKNKAYDETRNYDEQKKFALEYMNYMLEEFKEETAIRLLRGILPKFFDGLHNSKKLKNELCTSTKTKEDILNIFNKYSTL